MGRVPHCLLPIWCRQRMMMHLKQRHAITITMMHERAYSSGSESSASSPAASSAMSRIRNVGIIAHIDAGKTTTTERFLYYAGLTEEMGDVDRGDTITDYMEQERERGITITSAAVTFPWLKHRINLIDTPGHVDFTVEVERALSVLDSALVVLDASAGVEAQTITVWHQADRHLIPRIVYLNKMDKQTADVNLCLQSIRQLGSRPLLLHHPIKSGPKDFNGIVDLVSLQKLTWTKGGTGDVFTTTALDESDSLFQECCEKRESLVAALADADECIAEEVFKHNDTRDISVNQVISALRRVTIDQKFIPVLLGSSFKKVAVQPLMDAIISILPSPIDVMKRNTSYFAGFLCALAFKVIHHKRLGPLTFVRIYSGEVRANSKIYNLNRNRVEHVSKVHVALADDFKEVPFLNAGNIAVVTGLECITGDTLVTSAKIVEEVKRRYAIDAGDRFRKAAAAAAAAAMDESGTVSSRTSCEDTMRTREALAAAGSPMEQSPERSDDSSHPVPESLLPLLAGPLVPEPVFFCSIESPSPSKQKDLELGLKQLQREDPSLKVRVDDSGQIILSGMGELHIDILKDRLLKEYDVDAFLGPLQVAYRESIETEVKESANVNKNIAGIQNACNIVILLKPGDLGRKKSPLKVIITKDNGLGKMRRDHEKAIENGIQSAFACGPMLNFPVLGVRVELHWFESTNATSSAFISSVVSTVVTSGLRKADIALLEPVMKLEITAPVNYSTRIIGDLSSRRSQLGEVSERHGVRFIESVTPLSDLVNYSSALRSLSSGTATLSMHFLSYKRMTESEKRIAKEKVTGFAS